MLALKRNGRRIVLLDLGKGPGASRQGEAMGRPSGGSLRSTPATNSRLLRGRGRCTHRPRVNRNPGGSLRSTPATRSLPHGVIRLLMLAVALLAPAGLHAGEPAIRGLDVRGLQIGGTTTI